MPLNEDLESIENALDGALDDVALVELNARLETNAELASLQQQSMHDRAVRAAVWESLEGDEGFAQRLIDHIRAGRNDDSGHSIGVHAVTASLPGIKSPLKDASTSVAGRSRRIERFATVLAGIAACLLAGFWMGRHLPAKARDGTSPLLARVGPGDVPRVEPVLQYQVRLKDPSGATVAVQTFDSEKQAYEFAQDLQRWQEHQEQLQHGTPLVVMDRF